MKDLLFLAASALFIILLQSLFFKKEYKRLKINCTKKRFVEEILNWCILNMKKSSKSTPNLILRYYYSKKALGQYNFYSKTITIWYPKDSDIESIVSTVIHEYQHFIEIKSNKENILYDRHNNDFGYNKNPYEVSARLAEKKFTSDCIDSLIVKKVIA